MSENIKISGVGHAVGTELVLNSDTSIGLGLSPDSLERRTGIVSRHVCSKDESVTTLALDAIRTCVKDAGLELQSLGPETVLLYIQNGLNYLTPPPGIIVTHQLGLPTMRVMSIDGVCSEPIHAIEIATLMLEKRTCDRVIICASADFLPIVDPKDQDTIGLFGSGAGAIMMRRNTDDEQNAIHSIAWGTDSRYWDLGTITLDEHRQTDLGVEALFSYYNMKGSDLARVTVRTIKGIIERVTHDANWAISDVDHYISHQPNPKMLEMGVRKLGIGMDKVMVPGRTHGNMGPASVLVALSILKQQGDFVPGKKLLIVSFGLGFSCGAISMTS